MLWLKFTVFLDTCEDIGYISVKTKHTCLKKFHTPQFWVDANNTCVYDGGHLFTIKTLDVLNEVLSLTSAIGKYMHVFVYSTGPVFLTYNNLKRSFVSIKHKLLSQLINKTCHFQNYSFYLHLLRIMISQITIKLLLLLKGDKVETLLFTCRSNLHVFPHRWEWFKFRGKLGFSWRIYFSSLVSTLG